MENYSSGGLGLRYIDMNDGYHIRLRDTIAKENDELRRSIPDITKPNIIRITEGIKSMGHKSVQNILRRVRTFSKFTENNDPCGHHNFGCFRYRGKNIFWTIDNCGGKDVYNLVLTVMLDSEW
ncbi:MAG: DUF3768 domain-containing protein [Elusimicrobia bacterium]|nr:DUF3768 domain-containing protein [Elusimicrobiota bacterium]